MGKRLTTARQWVRSNDLENGIQLRRSYLNCRLDTIRTSGRGIRP